MFSIATNCDSILTLQLRQEGPCHVCRAPTSQAHQLTPGTTSVYRPVEDEAGSLPLFYSED